MSKQVSCEERIERLGLLNMEKGTMKWHMAEVYKIMKAVGNTKTA